MRHKKRLIAIVAMAAVGLGWLYWAHRQESVARYVFDFEARVEGGESVAFRSAVGCYPFEVGTGNLFSTATIYATRDPTFSAKLKSGRTFYVAVPDICAYVRRPDGRLLEEGWGDWKRPEISTPHEIVPLTYLTDEYERPETIRLFTALTGKSPFSEFEILHSTVQQFDPARDQQLEERRDDRSDPLGPSFGSSRNWKGVVFLPVPEATALEPAWIQNRWSAGVCEIIHLNEEGRQGVSELDSYASSIGGYWPNLGQGIALSDLFVVPNPNGGDTSAARAGFDSVIPVHFARDRFEIEPEKSGTVELFEAKASDMLFRPSDYYFNGIQLSDQSGKQRLPFVIRCGSKSTLYVPAVIHFSRRQL